MMVMTGGMLGQKLGPEATGAPGTFGSDGDTFTQLKAIYSVSLSA